MDNSRMVRGPEKGLRHCTNYHYYYHHHHYYYYYYTTMYYYHVLPYTTMNKKKPMEGGERSEAFHTVDGLEDVVEVELLAAGAALSVAADEDDDGDDDGGADGGAGGDDDLVHVRRRFLLHADLTALSERHRLRRHIRILQRHDAHHQTFLLSTRFNSFSFFGDIFSFIYH